MGTDAYANSIDPGADSYEESDDIWLGGYYNDTEPEYDTTSSEQASGTSPSSGTGYAAPGRSMAGTTAPIWVMLFAEGEAPRSDVNLSQAMQMAIWTRRIDKVDTYERANTHAQTRTRKHARANTHAHTRTRTHASTRAHA